MARNNIYLNRLVRIVWSKSVSDNHWNWLPSDCNCIVLNQSCPLLTTVSKSSTASTTRSSSTIASSSGNITTAKTSAESTASGRKNRSANIVMHFFKPSHAHWHTNRHTATTAVSLDRDGNRLKKKTSQYGILRFVTVPLASASALVVELARELVQVAVPGQGLEVALEEEWASGSRSWCSHSIRHRQNRILLQILHQNLHQTQILQIVVWLSCEQSQQLPLQLCWHSVSVRSEKPLLTPARTLAQADNWKSGSALHIHLTKQACNWLLEATSARSALPSINKKRGQMWENVSLLLFRNQTNTYY